MINSNGTKPGIWPYLLLPLVLTALFGPVLMIEWRVMQGTGGVFMYPLDDTFIQMSVAKTLAYDHTWGISAKTFESASSSLLYTLILAGLFKIFSAHIIIPFLVNALSGAAIVIVIQRWMRQQLIPAPTQFFILVAIIFLTPLPILIITGMEHTLQCLISLLFIFHFSSWVAKQEKSNTGNWNLPWNLLVLAVLACTIRYEGLFMVGAACLLLLIKKHYRAAVQLGIWSLLPILVFGIYAVGKGGFFLPNSVLLKSTGPVISVSGIFHYFIDVLLRKLIISNDRIGTVAAQRLLLILPLSFLFFSKTIRQNSIYQYSFILLLATTFLHISFAATGWFYRYEAYLILCTIMTLSGLICKKPNHVFQWFLEFPVAKGFLSFVLFLPMMERATDAFRVTSQACINIFDQQFQMATFLQKYYPNDIIAVNDIGAVSFYKRSGNIDLWGLANTKIAKSKMGHYYSPQFLDSLTRNEGAKIAMVYENWFSPALLSQWDKVATWEIPNNVICGDSEVSIYAIDRSIAEDLKKNLLEYQHQSLPHEVKVDYGIKKKH